MSSSIISLDNAIISIDGNVIGRVDDVFATVKISENDESSVEFSNTPTSKSFSGTFDVEYVDDDFLTWIKTQKDIQKKKKRRLQQAKNKKENMREVLSSYFKKGRRW